MFKVKHIAFQIVVYTSSRTLHSTHSHTPALNTTATTHKVGHRLQNAYHLIYHTCTLMH